MNDEQENANSPHYVEARAVLIEVDATEAEVWAEYMAWRLEHPKTDAVKHIVMDDNNRVVVVGNRGEPMKQLHIYYTTGAWLCQVSRAVGEYGRRWKKDETIAAMGRLLASRSLSDKIFDIWSPVEAPVEVEEQVSPVAGETPVGKIRANHWGTYTIMLTPREYSVLKLERTSIYDNPIVSATETYVTLDLSTEAKRVHVDDLLTGLDIASTKRNIKEFKVAAESLYNKVAAVWDGDVAPDE